MIIDVRQAKTSDACAMKRIIDNYSGKVMVDRSLLTLYEDIDEFSVVESGGRLLACGALHIRRGDTGEIRAVAVRPDQRGRGVGSTLVRRLVEAAREAGLRHVFLLTFEIEFFARFGFRIVAEDRQTVSVGHGRLEPPARNGATLLLDEVEAPTNTLGNTMMVLDL